MELTEHQATALLANLESIAHDTAETRANAEHRSEMHEEARKELDRRYTALFAGLETFQKSVQSSNEKFSRIIADTKKTNAGITAAIAEIESALDSARQEDVQADDVQTEDVQADAVQTDDVQAGADTVLSAIAEKIRLAATSLARNQTNIEKLTDAYLRNKSVIMGIDSLVSEFRHLRETDASSERLGGIEASIGNVSKMLSETNERLPAKAAWAAFAKTEDIQTMKGAFDEAKNTQAAILGEVAEGTRQALSINSRLEEQTEKISSISACLNDLIREHLTATER
jgi:hypothetical protein